MQKVLTLSGEANLTEREVRRAKGWSNLSLRKSGVFGRAR